VWNNSTKTSLHSTHSPSAPQSPFFKIALFIRLLKKNRYFGTDFALDMTEERIETKTEHENKDKLNRQD